MPRRNDHISLSEALRAFTEENNLKQGLKKLDVRDAWKNLLGPGVATYTQEVHLKDKTLYVTLTSSVLREELGYGKSKIISMINEELGEEAVKELVLY